MQVVILAGGLGTRRYPETHHIPKALLPVNGRPFIDWQLDKLAKHGFTEAVICIGHLGQKIIDHLGCRKFGMRILYSDDGLFLRGTMGAVKNAHSMLQPIFLMTYGDSYLPFDYSSPMKMLTDCDAVMSVFFNQNRYCPSNVKTDGERILSYGNGGDWIDYGAIAMRRGVDLGLAIEKGKVRACVAKERFFEIGTKAGHMTLEAYLDHR